MGRDELQGGPRRGTARGLGTRRRRAHHASRRRRLTAPSLSVPTGFVDGRMRNRGGGAPARGRSGRPATGDGARLDASDASGPAASTRGVGGHDDELVSESARRWPAWRARVVPRIIASLLAISGDTDTTTASSEEETARQKRALSDSNDARTTRTTTSPATNNRVSGSVPDDDEKMRGMREGAENVPLPGVGTLD